MEMPRKILWDSQPLYIRHKLGLALFYTSQIHSPACTAKGFFPLILDQGSYECADCVTTTAAQKECVVQLLCAVSCGFLVTLQTDLKETFLHGHFRDTSLLDPIPSRPPSAI